MTEIEKLQAERDRKLVQIVADRVASDEDQLSINRVL
jgi:hypothetical protein